MKIAIRADGGSVIGMGHIMRTLVLAKELSKENDVFYVCIVEKMHNSEIHVKERCSEVSSLEQLEKLKIDNSKYIQGIKKILYEGFKVILLDENRLINGFQEFEADLLITDSYAVNEEYFEETKKIFKRTAYIDDTNKYYFNVDFLINQNPDAEDFKYKVSSNTKLLLGTDHILLRNEFKNIINKHIKEKVWDIMVTVGGADPYRLTEKILNCTNSLNYKFHVVIGPSFVDTAFVENFNSNNVKFYYNANMHEIMKKCDMAISTCGSTLYELAACGVPTLGIIIADNQQGIGTKLDKKNVIKCLGWYDKISKGDLIYNINKLANDYILRKSFSEKASKLVDGKGAERIAKVLGENT